MNCLRTSRNASCAPRLSNLLIATTSAKSSMSIFSSCVAAPNSGVITYNDTSLWSMISVSLWPMPLVSSTIKSNWAAFKMSRASWTWRDRARLDWRVASERMYTRSEWMAFIRMRSPRRAPPVFRLEGSTLTRAMRFSGKSSKKRRTSSSTMEDFPAPPVPVIPRTGTVGREARTGSNALPNASALFSAAVMHRARSRTLRSPNLSMAPSRSSREGTVLKSAFSIKSLIMPCNPMARPSSGW